MKCLNNRITQLLAFVFFLNLLNSFLIAKVGLKYKHFIYDFPGKGEDKVGIYLPEVEPGPDKLYYGFFEVLDGHFGSDASEFFKKTLRDNISGELNSIIEKGKEDSNKIKEILKIKIEEAESEWKGRKIHESSGTTAVVAVITYSDEAFNNLYIANIGDSKAVLSVNGGAKELTTDHVPDNETEKKRFIDADIQIDPTKLPCKPKDTWIESQGEYPLTRVLGAMKKKSKFLDLEGNPLILSIPDISIEKITASWEFLILGSDGLWDWVEPQEAVNIVKKNINDLDVAMRNLVNAVKEETKKAEKKEFCDDTSFIIVKFEYDMPEEEEEEEEVEPAELVANLSL